jgi:ferredoxin
MAGARKAVPLIDPTRCTGCGWCVAVCAPHVLSLQTQGFDKRSVLHDAAGCTGCALCHVRCPFGAITMAKSTPVPVNPASQIESNGSSHHPPPNGVHS